MANLLTRRRLRVALGLLASAALMASATPAYAAALLPAAAPAVQALSAGGPEPAPVATAPPGDDGEAVTPVAPGIAQAVPATEGPSAEYLDAMAHATDRPAFTPGGP
ncbi:MAG TPA: hypothetical protein VN771_06315, partial [Candidatus Baltobacteraceae bacterium]|nr:hypothetical protein [Candidatus Baltobacteraceae bacterium]